MPLKETKATGVLLMTMGDVPSLSGIMPFMLRLFSDPSIIRAPAPVRYPLSAYISLKKYSTMRARYLSIGGGSPMNRITRLQAEALEKALGAQGGFRVYVANRYCAPDTAEAYRKIKSDGIRRLVALPLYPHYSDATTGSSFAALEKMLEKDMDPPDVRWIKSFSSDEGYLRAFSGKVREALGSFDEKQRQDVDVIFSAHSLPREFIEGGDPYLDELTRTVEGAAAIIKPRRYHLSFQSKGGGGRPWLKPETDEILKGISSAGRHGVVIVPISFVAENIETLYDIDVLYMNTAKSLGIKGLVRAKCLDADPGFIQALAGLVRASI